MTPEVYEDDVSDEDEDRIDFRNTSTGKLPLL